MLRGFGCRQSEFELRIVGAVVFGEVAEAVEEAAGRGGALDDLRDRRGVAVGVARVAVPVVAEVRVAPAPRGGVVQKRRRRRFSAGPAQKRRRLRDHAEHRRPPQRTGVHRAVVGRRVPRTERQQVVVAVSRELRGPAPVDEELRIRDGTTEDLLLVRVPGGHAGGEYPRCAVQVARVPLRDASAVVPRPRQAEDPVVEVGVQQVHPEHLPQIGEARDPLRISPRPSERR